MYQFTRAGWIWTCDSHRTYVHWERVKIFVATTRQRGRADASTLRSGNADWCVTSYVSVVPIKFPEWITQKESKKSNGARRYVLANADRQNSGDLACARCKQWRAKTKTKNDAPRTRDDTAFRARRVARKLKKLHPIYLRIHRAICVWRDRQARAKFWKFRPTAVGEKIANRCEKIAADETRRKRIKNYTRPIPVFISLINEIIVKSERLCVFVLCTERTEPVRTAPKSMK